MSVINQMLRDLDARGGADAASRRAAMAVAGHAVGHREPGWRSARRWWPAALGVVALGSTLAFFFAGRGPIERPLSVAPSQAGPAQRDVDATPHDAPVPPTAVALEPPSEPVELPALRGAGPETPLARPAAPPRPEAATAPRPQPAPPPASKAVIERVPPDDPLAAAREALAGGRAEASLAALAAEPVSPERDALEAAALQQLGRHAEAEQAYRRALRGESGVGAWWAGLGISLDAEGRAGEAIEAFREAQRRGPLDPALADYLGERIETLSAGEPSR